MRVERVRILTVGRQLRLLLITLVTICVVLFLGLVNVFASDDPGMLADPPTGESVVDSAVMEDVPEGIPSEEAVTDNAEQFPEEKGSLTPAPSGNVRTEDGLPSEIVAESETPVGGDSDAGEVTDGKDAPAAAGEDGQTEMEEPGKGGEADMDSVQKKTVTVILYRMYHPGTGEHFYTTGVNERNQLAMIGWKYEGIAWTSPEISETPVYRLYSPVLRDHHYTISEHERDVLVSRGWRYEGIGWYSDDNKETAIYRQFDPKRLQGSHVFTVEKSEVKGLGKKGWIDEGIAWYGILDPDPEILYPMTIADGVDYAKVYDYEYYKTHNPDVVAVYGNNDGLILNHFVTSGTKELRSGNGVFEARSYIYEYRDLRRVFKDDYRKYYAHYSKTGYKENRHQSGCTSLQNPDYRYAGVDFSPIFDYNYYVSHYPSVVKRVGFTDYTLVEYFAKNGLKKSQQAKASYNKKVYTKIKDHFYPPHDAMYYTAQPFSSATNWLILVNRGSRTVQLYTGSRNNWTENRKIVCDVGAAATPTITGEYALGAKMLYFMTGDCRCWYASQISGGYLFHSVIYDGQSSPVNIVDGTLGQAVSHGCVRMDIKDAKYIYNNVPSGTKIYIYN
uniref:L,D-transpeptidase family protein n=1 Tax=Eubacterium cellulosolvens TaxID=29322 RepID=UPI0009DF9A16|nr:L,D-transpeptidase family protein [[Eubacterium] cellulosolvens]